MSIVILEKLFGSIARVKLMKLFLFNPDSVFLTADIISKTKIDGSHINKEIKLLEEVGMIRKRGFLQLSTDGKKKTKKTGFILNPNFKFLSQLQNLLINNEALQSGDIINRLNKTGKLQLVIISGLFIQAPETRVDLFVVADNIKDRTFKRVISEMEADIGKELRYSLLSTEDYKYRYNVCDRLVRDIFEYPHEVIVDRLGL